MSLFKPKTRAKVLFVASEAAPFIKAGGLGQVMFALPRALQRIGYDVRVMMPRYAGIDLEKFSLGIEHEGLEVPSGIEGDKNGGNGDNEGSKPLICNIKRYSPKNGESHAPVTTYFLENLEYYEKRSNIYGYNDDAVRWALLCRGTLEFLKISKWLPDIVITSDWQTGFLCNYLKTIYKDDPILSRVATVFMIHNLAFQGLFDPKFVSEMDFDDGHSPVPAFHDPRLLKINGMRRGIMYADVISTVSQTYAKEIMTQQYGETLDGLLRERRSRVYGILNGIDYENFNPETDEYLVENYDENNLRARRANKKELQARFGLEDNPDAFLISIASRFTGQKGFDLLFSISDILLKELNIQFAILGSGEGHYMGFFQELEKRFPGRVGTHLAFDNVLPHVVHGGADAILIPSLFEPCGLLQHEAMRYGSIPIARKTGGLADTVEDYNSTTQTGTGFVFKEYDPYSLMVAITRAHENFRNKNIWQKLQKSAMTKDFSWNNSAKEYAHLFTVALGFKKRDIEARQ
jgi:starch synthase